MYYILKIRILACSLYFFVNLILVFKLQYISSHFFNSLAYFMFLVNDFKCVILINNFYTMIAQIYLLTKSAIPS